MTLRNPYRGMSEPPFPGAKPTRQMRLEDEFMQLHGGAGARSVYLGVEALSRLVEVACRPMACLVRIIANYKTIRRQRRKAISSQPACGTR